MKDRSANDHMFTVRILEEKLLDGTKLFVLSIDLQKASEKVSHVTTPETLRTRGVPHFLKQDH